MPDLRGTGWSPEEVERVEIPRNVFNFFESAIFCENKGQESGCGRSHRAQLKQDCSEMSFPGLSLPFDHNARGGPSQEGTETCPS